MNAQSLARRFLVWFSALVWAGLIFFLSSLPLANLPKLPLDELPSAGAHLCVYAVLMALLVGALRQGSGLSAGRAWLIAFALTALYGLSDEYHQSFVPGRDAGLSDWVTDLVGAVLVWVLLARRERRQYPPEASIP